MTVHKILDPPRETILYRAAELFARQGYPATTMRDLAAALGVTPAALYYHFRSKDDLLLGVMLHGIQMVHERVRRAMEREPTVAQRIWAGLRAHLLACLEYQQFVAVILQESRYLSPEAARAVIAARDAYEDLWARARAEGQREGLFQPHVDLRLLRLFGFGAMNWVAVWYRPGGGREPEEIADAFLLYMARGVLRADIADLVIQQVARQADLACGRAGPACGAENQPPGSAGGKGAGGPGGRSPRGAP